MFAQKFSEGPCGPVFIVLTRIVLKRILLKFLPTFLASAPRDSTFTFVDQLLHKEDWFCEADQFDE
jgi:hypothetical protein